MLTNEETISDFMRHHYTDERLSWLLAHAESGNLVFQSCCCFIGVPTADHALRGKTHDFVFQCLEKRGHYFDALKLAGANQAELAYAMLAIDDKGRVAKLIPLIHAEIQRREREAEVSSSSPAPEYVAV